MKSILPIAVAALMVAPTAAHAGSYRVYACDGPDDGPLSMRPFAAYESPEQTFNHDDLCREPGGVAAVRFSVPTARAGGWSLRAPAGATLTHVHWNGGVSGLAGAGARAELDTDRGAVGVWREDLPPDLRYFPLPQGATVVALRLTCHAAACVGSPRLTIRALSATLEDPDPPSVSALNPLPAVAHGPAVVSFAGTDPVAGVARATLTVDGVARTTSLCEPAIQSVHPCPTAVTVDLPWATAGVRDGTHTVAATLDDAAGNTRAVLAPTSVVTDNAPPAPGTVTVSRAGQTLTASASGFDGQDVSLGYRWQRCDPDCEDVAGATRSRYTLTADDAGHGVRAVVTATDLGGATTARSEPLAIESAPAATPLAAPSAPPTAPWPVPAAPSPCAGGTTPAGAMPACLRVSLSRRTIKIPYGKRVEIRGRVTDGSGRALAGATLDVSARVRKPGAKARREGGIGTARDGRFTYVAPAGPSRDLTIGGKRVTLLVTAAGTFNATRAGTRVRFSGRLRGGHIPRGGVLVEIRSGHRVVALARTDGRGAFKATTKATRLSFRAKARKDSSWPFVAAPVGPPVSA